jgi:hypothetical protein
MRGRLANENGGLGLPDDLGYVECEVRMGWGRTSRFKEDMLGYYFKKMIEVYKEQTGDRHGRGFRDLAERMRVKIREEKET